MQHQFGASWTPRTARFSGKTANREEEPVLCRRGLVPLLDSAAVGCFRCWNHDGNSNVNLRKPRSSTRLNRQTYRLVLRRSQNSKNPSEHEGAVLVDAGHVNMHSPSVGPTIHDRGTASGPCAVIAGVVSSPTTSQLLESPIPAQQRARRQAPTANPGTPSENQTTGASTLRQKVGEEKPF